MRISDRDGGDTRWTHLLTQSGKKEVENRDERRPYRSRSSSETGARRFYRDRRDPHTLRIGDTKGPFTHNINSTSPEAPSKGTCQEAKQHTRTVKRAVLHLK